MPGSTQVNIKKRNALIDSISVLLGVIELVISIPTHVVDLLVQVLNLLLQRSNLLIVNLRGAPEHVEHPYERPESSAFKKAPVHSYDLIPALGFVSNAGVPAPSHLNSTSDSGQRPRGPAGMSLLYMNFIFFPFEAQ